MQARTSSTSSRCCSSNASLTFTTRRPPRHWKPPAEMRSSRPCPRTMLRHPRRCPLERCQGDHGERRQGHRRRLPLHRGSQRFQASRHLRRCRLDQQEAPARPSAQGPHRALQRRDAIHSQLSRGRTRPGLRVPHQEVCGRLGAHRPGVLHQPYGRPPDDRDPPAQDWRVHL